MGKVIVMLVCMIAFVCTGAAFFFLTTDQDRTVRKPVVAEVVPKERESGYRVFIEGVYDRKFAELNDAQVYAENHSKAAVWSDGEGRFVWDNYPPFQVYYTNTEYKEFESYTEALIFAKAEGRTFMYYRKNDALIWSNVDPLPESYKIENVPFIEQLPELPRGCEVTSLAMLMRYKGMDVTKFDLAERIEKDPTPYTRTGSTIHFGHPNRGFVGDMYNLSIPGLGVYHAPIHRLLERYFPDAALDVTGASFEDLFNFICRRSPVWVIVPSTFKRLPPDEFITWSTDWGEIDVTYREHSVLVTGYDSQYIYFNDPLSEKPNSKAPRNNFIDAWVQMGSQAVTIAR